MHLKTHLNANIFEYGMHTNPARLYSLNLPLAPLMAITSLAMHMLAGSREQGAGSREVVKRAWKQVSTSYGIKKFVISNVDKTRNGDWPLTGKVDRCNHYLISPHAVNYESNHDTERHRFLNEFSKLFRYHFAPKHKSFF
ncbi:hypothetical protein GQX74_014973 [Glossina fuscipes]|nr:hypothetical protein GQX74_014973 [Glossina fuscipes]